MLEEAHVPVNEVSAAAGYDDASLFRRLFKGSTGLPPSDYTRMFQPMRAR